MSVWFTYVINWTEQKINVVVLKVDLNDCNYLINKAIVNNTSPALCTLVTPLPQIGDVAYRQYAGGRPSHGHRQHAQKMVKIAHVVPEISSRTDRQTETQTDIGLYSSQQFATAPAGEVITVINRYLV